jgi:hypothetical protein
LLDLSSLFCVAAQVPAGWIARVRKQGVGTWLVDVAVVLGFVLVVLLFDQEVVLDGDGGVRIMAQMQDERVAEIKQDKEDDEEEVGAEQKALHAGLL